MPVIASLAMAQLRHRPGRWVLLALGLALTVAVPVVSSGVATTVAAQTVRRTVSQLDLADRSLLVTQEPLSRFRIGTPAQADQRVRALLAQLSTHPARRELIYHELTLAGSSFYLAGADRLDTAVRSVTGRLPATCTPKRCEVVLVASKDQPDLVRAVQSLGVVVVGRAERTDPQLVSGKLDTGGLPLLVGNGADAMAALSSLELFARTLAWSADLDVERVVRLGVPGYVQRSADVDAALSATVGGTTLFRPDAALQEQDRRAALSARRFGLLGGTAAVLLLGFAVIAAVSLRREHTLLVTTLRRRGATNTQVGGLTALEAGVPCLIGAGLGVALGCGVAAVAASRAGLAISTTVGHAASGAAVALVLLTVVAAAVTCAVLLWPDTQARGLWHLLDLLALCSLGAAVLAADRGSASTADLAAGGGDPLIVALPVLSAITAGLVAARLWGPFARLTERLLPRRSLAARIALLGSIRRPLRPLATTAFLTAAVAAVIFAGAYRATLLEGSADQAAYAVPLDATIKPGDAAGTVSDLPDLRASVPGSAVYPTVRTAGAVNDTVGVATALTVLGVDPQSLQRADRWSRTTGSSEPPSALAGRLQAPLTRTAPVLPAGRTTVDLAVQGLSKDLSLTLWLRDRAGREVAVSLTAQGAHLVGTLPAAGPYTAVAIVVQEEADYATHRQHSLGEGKTDQPTLAGTLTFGEVRADGTPVVWDWAGWGSANGTVGNADGSLALTYRMQGSAVVTTPSFVANGELSDLPVIADPQTAQAVRDGRLALQVAGQPVAARVVATLPRMPTVSGPFILANRDALIGRLDRLSPGSASPSELWITAPSASQQLLDRTLQQPVYQTLQVDRRDAVQADLEADPVGRGSRLLLAVVAGLALAVGSASLVLLVVGERRDGAGELHAWEADGVRPATLRRMLFVRMLAVVGVGLPVGVLAGYLTARVGARLVGIDASGTTPQPPLQTTFGSGWTVLVLVVGLGFGILVAGLVVLRTLRERLPARPEVDLR